MLDGEMASGAALPGHYFIRDKQNTVATADLGHLLEITVRRDGRAQRRSTHRFRDECCRFSVSQLDGAFQFFRILPGALLAVVCTAIAVWKSNLCKLPHHRQINLAPP